MPKQTDKPGDDSCPSPTAAMFSGSSSERSVPEPSETPPLAEKPWPKEYGGRKGPDPVRYGDWEKNGRCIDF